MHVKKKDMWTATNGGILSWLSHLGLDFRLPGEAQMCAVIEVEQATTGGEGGNRTWLVDCRVCLQSHLRSVSLCDEINDAELGPRLSTTQWCIGQGFALCIAEQITIEPWLCLQTRKPHREFKVRKKNWIYITALSYTIRLQYWRSFHLESVSDRNDFLCFPYTFLKSVESIQIKKLG